VCGDSVLAGGAGDDVLRGGSGKDVLSGDADGPPGPIPYTTVLTESGAIGNDDIDGGPGVDTLTFRGRATDVAVDLTAGSSAGAGGERDRVAGVEDVSGGDGDDLLIGDAGVNRIEGDSGDDRIDGRGGNDYLLGNLVPNTNEFGIGYTPPDPGADTLRGGAGDDTLDAGSERGDVLSGGAGDDALQDDLGGPTRAQKVRCGAGTDTIDFVPRGQLLSDCERLRFASGQRFTIRPQIRARGGLRYVLHCRQIGGCSMGMAVRVRSSRPARRALSTRGARPLAFLMRPRRAARRGDVVDATILVATAYGTTYAARWRVTL
jgi:Ca2+-binding RTX toxin-like protein